MRAITFRVIAVYLILVVTVAAVWGLTTVPSFADEPPPAEEPGDEDRAESDADIQPYSSSATLNATQIENPYGCVGQTDYPHRSTHAGGQRVNVIAWTECDVPVPVIYTATQLFHRTCKWLGFVCAWEPYGLPGSTIAYSSRYTEANSSEGPCVNNWYMGLSHHYIIDANGDRYSADTTRTMYVNNC